MICAPTTLAIGIRRQGSNNPVAEAQTHEALTQVLIANDGEVIQRLRLSAAEAARVCNVTPRQLIYWTKKGLVKPSTNDDLEDELRRRFEKLEERVSQLRRTLPASLTIARLRRAVALLARLEAEG